MGSTGGAGTGPGNGDGGSTGPGRRILAALANAIHDLGAAFAAMTQPVDPRPVRPDDLPPSPKSYVGTEATPC